MFTCLDYEISCEPTLPNGRKIDFLLRRGDAAFYLEATAAGMPSGQRGAGARRDRIYRELDQVKTTAFMPGISITYRDGVNLVLNWNGEDEPDGGQAEADRAYWAGYESRKEEGK